jgi:ricin-type beta-trefoil lectin protein
MSDQLVTDGLYTLTNQSQLLTVGGTGTLALAAATGDSTQQWHIAYESDSGIYTLTNVSTGLYLAPSQSPAPNVSVMVASHPSAWQFTAGSGTDAFTLGIAGDTSGQLLASSSGQLVMQPPGTAADQTWTVQVTPSPAG